MSLFTKYGKHYGYCYEPTEQRFILKSTGELCVCDNVKDKAGMKKHEIMLILERYDVDPKTHNVIADKILALSSLVGRSEQLVCQTCGVPSDYIQENRCSKCWTSDSI